MDHIDRGARAILLGRLREDRSADLRDAWTPGTDPGGGTSRGLASSLRFDDRGRTIAVGVTKLTAEQLAKRGPRSAHVVAVALKRAVPGSPPAQADADTNNRGCALLLEDRKNVEAAKMLFVELGGRSHAKANLRVVRRNEAKA